MDEDVQLVYGTKTRILQPLADFRVRAVAAPGLSGQVELVASVVASPAERRAMLPTATTLAIHMDRQAATDLLQQLIATFQTMDWPLPRTDATPT